MWFCISLYPVLVCRFVYMVFEGFLLRCVDWRGLWSCLYALRGVIGVCRVLAYG